VRSRVLRVVVLSVVLVAAACGDDDGGDESSSATGDEATTTTSSTSGSGGGAVTIDDLETSCDDDDLTAIVTDLRGDAPETVEPSGTPPGPVEVNVNDATYTSAACIYGYAGNTFQDPNRVTLRIDQGDIDTPAVRDAMFDSLSFDTEVPDLGDAARYFHQVAVDAHSNVHVLIGDTVLTVRVDVPGDLENEVFLTEGPMVDAATSFVGVVEA
jgi:hypothetical protein